MLKGYRKHEEERLTQGIPALALDAEQVADLVGFLSGTLHQDHYFSNIKAQPGPSPDSIPNIWLLGSSDFSARLAAVLGLPFSFADFFGTSSEHGPMIVDLYRQQLHPSNYCPEPKVNVALQVICSETQKEAEFIATIRDIAIQNPEEVPDVCFIPIDKNIYPIFKMFTEIDASNSFFKNLLTIAL